VTADTSAMDPAASKPRLGDLFVQRGLINHHQLAEALEEQRHKGGKLGEILVEKGWVSRVDLAGAISKQWDGIGLTTSRQRLREAAVRADAPSATNDAEPALRGRIEQLTREIATKAERIARQSETIDVLLARVAELEGMLAGRDGA
jgi:hypothetical protein